MDAPTVPEVLSAISRVVLLSILSVGSIHLPVPLEAQALHGRVLEDGRDSPVPGATLSLLTRNGEEVAQAATDASGRFVLRPPRAAQYIVRVVRLGYATTQSPLLQLEADGRVDLDFLVQPLPIGLMGLEVTVETEIERMVRNFGLRIPELGRRWIDRERIEEIPTALGATDVVRWQGIPGVYIQERSTSRGVTPLCVRFWRAATLRASNPPCAITFLNGAKIDPVEANQISPEELESILVLTPVESTGLYGTEGGAGAVLLWTRRGGR